VSTGLTCTRLGDYQLAISDIFGGTAFRPVLFLIATVLSGRAVLPQAHHTGIYLTALGGLLTIVYMPGLVFGPFPNGIGCAWALTPSRYSPSTHWASTGLAFIGG
jgi:hypothetical protein